MSALTEFPDERVVNSSTSAVGGGFALLGAALIGGVGLSRAPHVKALFSRHRSTWATSPWAIERVGTFLVGWLILSGVFLIFAGSIPEIEVFREDSQLRAGVMLGAASVLLALFVFFCTWVAPLAHGANARAKGSSWFYWVGVLCVFVAFVLAAVAASGLSAWTLPSKQRGTLLFLAPGLGVTAGMLLLLLFTAVEVGWSLDSRPDGWRERPGEEDASAAYPDSTLPVVAALAAFVMSVASTDPALPLPLLIALLVSPKQRANTISAGVCVMGCVVGAFLVLR